MIRSWFVIEIIVVRRKSTGSESLGVGSGSLVRQQRLVGRQQRLVGRKAGGSLRRQWKSSDQGLSDRDCEESCRKPESIRLAAGPPLDDVV
jgi:hypothetical protein